MALLLVAGVAYAQGTIYVDTGGSDAYSGTSPNFINGQIDDQGRPIGPVRTVDAAIARVNEAGATEDVISIEANGAAGAYAPPTSGFDGDVDDITFEARNSGTFTQVRFTGAGTVEFTAEDLVFRSAGATFLFDDVDFEDGDVDLGDGVVAFVDNAQVEVTNNIASGNPTYLGSVDLLYNSDDDFATGALLPATFANGSTLTVALNDGGDTDLTLTLSEPIAFRTGTVDIVGENDIEGQITALGAPGSSNVLTFMTDNAADEVGNAGDVIIEEGATADFSSAAGNDFPEVDSIFNQGTLDFSGTTLQVLGDFNNQGAVVGGNIDLNGTETAEFAPGPGFDINRLRIGNGPNNDPDDQNEAKTVNFTEDVILVGNFVVFENSTAAIDDQSVTLEGSGNTVVIAEDARVSTTEQGALIFAGDSQEIQGDGMFGNLTVATTDDGIIVSGGDLEFDGTITLSTGGIDIDLGDLSPADSNTNALVVVNFEDTDANIDENGGTFNDRDNDFDLSYFGDATANSRTPEDEFDTPNLRDLLVRAEGTLDASNEDGGSISGDVTFTATSPTAAFPNNPGGNAGSIDLTVLLPGDDFSIAGTWTINNDVLATSQGGDITLTGNAVVNGELNGGDTLILTDGVSVTGTPANNAWAAVTIANIEIDEDAQVTINGLRVLGSVVTSEGDDSLLSLGLAADGEFSGGPVFFGGVSDAGNVTRDVDLDGGLTLLSDVEFVRDLEVDETLTLGTFDAILSEQGGTYSLEDIGEVVATTGALALYGSSSTFDGDGASLPNLRFGDDPRTGGLDFYFVTGDVTVTNTLRVNGLVDSYSNDSSSEDVTVTLADGGTYVVDSNGILGSTDVFIINGTPGPFAGSEIIFAGDFDLFTAADDFTVGAIDALFVGVIEASSTQTIGAYGGGALFDAGALFSGARTVRAAENLIVTTDPLAGTLDAPGPAEDPELNLAGNAVAVFGDVTILGDEDYVNRQYQDFGGIVTGRGTADDPISEIQFVGTEPAQLNTPSGVSLLGDGVDIRIAKEMTLAVTSSSTVQLVSGTVNGVDFGGGSVTVDDFALEPIIDASTGAIDTTTPVTLNGGAIAFDDQFDSSSSEDNDDETLILQSGIFEVGTPANQQSVYVRLDHENSIALQGFGNFDNGQGFVFADPASGAIDMNDASTALPDSYVGGNVRKRVANVASVGTPGRVIYPTGEKADSADEPDYAPFTFDFESSGAGAPFGARQVNVTFVGTSPGQNDSLPLADNGDGTTIEGVANFYWLVSTTGPAFGQGTTFNIEARSDDYEITGSTEDLELIRRQAGDVGANTYSGIGGDAQVFQIDLDGADEGDPADDAVIVQESVAQSFLGPQGTIISFGLAVSTRPVSTEELPTSFVLRGNVPNPFRTRTALAFDLAEAADVSVDVYDTMGRRVASIDAGALSAGADQRVAIDGAGLASGVYVFRLTVEGATETIVRTGQITLAR